ncbi:HIT family protein [Nocardioides bruguierae]|uniref:HIT family protein n=1 Tax=Nocardioides bruguierae TaxID=2945102 RepID=UPI0020224D8C|nr:HIT family protein [Nocardioides bruguierae]MCL8027489.1 HIT family protein [Nocardioides bruguierae]
MDDCWNCENEARVDDLPVRERVLLTEHWRVAHAFDTAVPGWLVMVPRRHVLALDELPEAALAEMGVLQGRLTAALRLVVGARKTYVMQFSEAPGFAHLHVHLVPRMPDPPDERKGPAVLGWLGVGEDLAVPADVRDALAERLAAALDDAEGNLSGVVGVPEP